MRRLSTDALVLGALLLALAVLSFRIAGQSPLPEDKQKPRRSVSSTRPGGWKAFALLLAQSGVPVQKIERDATEWPKNLRVLVSGPEYQGGFGVKTRWTDREAKSALTWVAEGRTLILLVSENTEIIDQLDLNVERGVKSEATLFPLQPAPFLAGVDGLSVPGTARFTRPPPDAVPLFADDKPAVLLLRHEKGTVIAVSDPAVAANKQITQADNARFLIALVRAYAGAGGAVGFDEYRQGFQESDSLWEAIGRPGQLAFWQLVVLTLLAAYSASRRFGLPRPLPAPARVSSEYVASLADLYRRAGAADAALEGVYLSFWRDLCRAVGLPYDAPTGDVLNRVNQALLTGRPEAQERLRRVVNECEGKIESGKVSHKELLPLARALDVLRKELELGGTDREPAVGPRG